MRHHFCCVAAIHFLLGTAVFAQPIEARWLAGQSGTWATSARWDIGVVPNNIGGGGPTYNAALPGGVYTATIDSAVTIERLTLEGSGNGPTLVVGAGGFLRANDRILVQNGARFRLSGGTVQNSIIDLVGGTMSATGNVTSTLRGVTINGSTLPLSRIRVEDGLTLNGTLNVNNASTCTFGGVQTIAGAGSIIGGTSQLTSGSILTLGSALTMDSVVQGAEASLINEGSIEARTVRLQNFTNIGLTTLRGSINADSLMNSGSIVVPAGVLAEITSASYSGVGTVSVAADSTLAFRGFIPEFDSRFQTQGAHIWLRGNVVTEGRPILADARAATWRLQMANVHDLPIQSANGREIDIENSTITNCDQQGIARVLGDSTFDGGQNVGTIILDGTARSAGAWSNRGVINGLGGLVLAGNWRNEGVVDIAAGGIEFQSLGINTGSIRVRNGGVGVTAPTFTTALFNQVSFDGGSVNLATNLDNSNAVLHMRSSVPEWGLQGSIQNGVVRVDPGTVVRIAPAQSLTLDGVELDGNLFFLTGIPGSTFRMRNGMSGNGVISFSTATTFIAEGSQLFDGPTLQMNDGQFRLQGVLTIGPRSEVVLANAAIREPLIRAEIVNQGRFLMGGLQRQFSFDSFRSPGLLRALPNSDVELRGVEGTLGRVEVDNARLSIIPALGTSEPLIFTDTLLDNGYLLPSGAWRNQGTITVRNGGFTGGNVSTFGSIQNGRLIEGTWRLELGGSISGPPITENAATVVLSGGEFSSLSALTLNSGVLTLTNGVDLGDESALLGPFSNTGLLDLGRGSELVLRAGALLAGGTLAIHLDPTRPAPHVRVIQPGGIEIAGELRVLLDGPEPVYGQTFRVIAAQTIVGRFDRVSFPSLAGGLGWELEYAERSVFIHVVPGPTGSILLIGLAGWVSKRSRRCTSRGFGCGFQSISSLRTQQ